MSAWLRLKKLMIRGSCNPRLMFQHTTLTELGGQRIANPTLEDKVRQEIIDSCRHANWKLGGPRGAAVRLGLKRTTLSHKMRRLGIERPPVEETAEPTLEDKVRSGNSLWRRAPPENCQPTIRIRRNNMPIQFCG
jgi:hypothetical protein